MSKMQSPEEEQNISLSGYNLYQSINDGDFELVEFIPYEFGDTTHNILFDADPKLACYQLRAVWISPLDTCISAAAISKENPEERFVCVLLTGDEEYPKKETEQIRCFPNPFLSTTAFEFELGQQSQVKINFFNHLGELVGLIQRELSKGKHQLTWHPKNLPSGLYYFSFHSYDTTSTGKLILLK